MEMDEDDDKTQPACAEESSIKCDFCGEFFMSRKALLFHNKSEYVEKVQVCWNYKKGNCLFGDSNCWFLHTDKADTIETCNVCARNFKTRKDLKIHEKNNRTEDVPFCKYDYGKTCVYGDPCWFRHDKHEMLQNQDFTTKLLSMLEKFTNRIIQIENEVKSIENKE